MLKSLELFGFKSFADRTRFDFAKGITCVVGPNGSGKSNVVDALKWILGDQSAKSLRGKDMVDVIFNGSSSRKPSAFAEATLTYDNSSGLLPIDAQEVHIGRRIWRNGDAEYLLNRAPSRLKDIKDLFLGTGAGSAAYSIIEQGRVDQILQANPTARRLVFEEAAGVSRFKARRLDAQRKLERVAQNLLRLTDIVDEVEAQLNSTRSQAAKAVKYREVSEDLKKWWLGLAGDDYRQLTAEIAVVDAALASSEGHLQELTDRQKVIESEEAAFDHEISVLDDRLRAVDRRNSAARESIVGQEATIQFQTARLQELEAEFTRLQKQQAHLRRRTSDARGEIELQQLRLQEVEAEYAENRARVTERDAALQGRAVELVRLRERIEGRRTEREQCTQQSAAMANQLATLHAQLEALQNSQQRVTGQLDHIDELIARLQSERVEHQQRLDAAQAGFTAAHQTLRDVQSRRSQLVGTQDDLKSRLAADREQRSAALARKSLLEDLELRQEGLNLGVKEILSRARTSDLPPWNTVIGGVADLLDVDLEHAALLEVALGGRSQLIVLREYQPLLTYLRSGAAQLSGRVGFLAIPDRLAGEPLPPTMRGEDFLHLELNSALLPDLNGHPGVISRADELVTGDHGILGLAAAVLADTWVVQTLDDAVRLATGPGNGCRFVTLQGEVLEHDGALHLGTVRSDTALLSRKSELRRIKNDLIQLDRQIIEQEESLKGVFQSLTSADGELEAAATSVDAASARLVDARAEVTACDQDLDRLKGDRRHQAEQLELAARELSARELDVERAEQQAGELARQAAELDRDIETHKQTLASAEREAQGLEQERAARQLDLVKQSERLDALRAQTERLEEEVRQRTLQSDEAERRLEAAVLKRQQTILNILNTGDAVNERYLAAETVQIETAALHAEKRELRQRRSRLVEAELALRKERRELADRRHAEEIRLRDMRHALETLAERLDEEYQVKLEDVAASGVSAYALHLDERHSSHDRRHHAEEHGEEAAAEAAHGSRTFDGASPPPFSEVRPELDAHVTRLRRKLKMMGSVNTDSLRDLESLETRFQQLSAQLQDLVEAKQTLEDIIRRINVESRKMFAETFEVIRTNFQDLFRKVFGGGEGDIILEDPDDILECGLDIQARPPGKELRSISLLSGGEKTMTAIALIMSIFKAKPSPFCILDEVDAALDEANVERFTSVVREFQSSTQFIMITHHKRSMVVADVLYGVTMEESGISKRMAVRFEDVSDDGHFKPPAQASVA